MKLLSKNKISKANKRTGGFALVEIIIATGIVSLSLLAITVSAGKTLNLSNHALKQTQASFFLEEGAEAVKTNRDNDWSTISALSTNTDYYLSFSAGA